MTGTFINQSGSFCCCEADPNSKLPYRFVLMDNVALSIWHLSELCSQSPQAKFDRYSPVQNITQSMKHSLQLSVNVTLTHSVLILYFIDDEEVVGLRAKNIKVMCSSAMRVL